MPDITALDEVVVVGYGEQKKSVVTGAISKPASVDDGTSVCDFDAIEKEHRYSIESHIVHFEYQGKRFNSPNDLAIDAQGRIWFTDPRYGDFRDDMELDHESVFRLEDDGWEVERTTSGGASINHTWMHLAVPELPFGGVGESARGRVRHRYARACRRPQAARRARAATLRQPVPGHALRPATRAPHRARHGGHAERRRLPAPAHLGPVGKSACRGGKATPGVNGASRARRTISKCVCLWHIGVANGVGSPCRAAPDAA